LSDLVFEPVERPQTLGERVYLALRAQLLAGSIEPGQPLQEVQLSARLGVSRTPVREAMARLASEGLLASDRRSFVVPALSRDDVDDIYEIRNLLEPAALRGIAASTTEPGRRVAIEAALAAAVAADRAGDADAFRDAHARFRAAWLALVTNKRLVRAVEQYSDHMQHIRTLTLGDAKVRTTVLRGLERMSAALAAGDGDAAADAMVHNLDHAKRAFVRATGLQARRSPNGRSRAP
jgi:DNA-binding GntR family transcriptional regulator